MAKRRSRAATFVTDASDRKQVEQAGRTVRLRADDALSDVRVVLATEPGRRFVMRVLKHCRVFETVFSQHAAIMAKHVGEQDVGHAVMQWVEAADPEALFRMMREDQQTRMREAAEAEASRIPSVAETE